MTIFTTATLVAIDDGVLSCGRCQPPGQSLNLYLSLAPVRTTSLNHLGCRQQNALAAIVGRAFADEPWELAKCSQAMPFPELPHVKTSTAALHGKPWPAGSHQAIWTAAMTYMFKATIVAQAVRAYAASVESCINGCSRKQVGRDAGLNLWIWLPLPPYGQLFSTPSDPASGAVSRLLEPRAWRLSLFWPPT